MKRKKNPTAALNTRFFPSWKCVMRTPIAPTLRTGVYRSFVRLSVCLFCFFSSSGLTKHDNFRFDQNELSFYEIMSC